jgi:dienelactone hydrolase
MALTTRSCWFARLLVSGLAVLAWSFPASAFGPPPDKGDLADGYQRIDQLVARLPNDPALRERANRCFDGLTNDFFAGRYDSALAELARLHGELLKLNEDGQEEQQFLFGHRFVLSKRAIVSGVPTTISLESLELERMQLGTPPLGFVAVYDGQRIERPYDEVVEFELPASSQTGHIEFYARFRLSGDVLVARTAVLPDGLDALRTRYDGRIRELAKRDALDEAEKISLLARSALLTETIDRTRTTSLLAHFPEIIEDLDVELARAERGERPFAGAGDVWRIYRVLGTDLPVRQFVPEGVGPFPLIIAFHGAGGDENIFFDGYGNGALKRAASGEGFAVVCPPTVPFGVSPNLLDAFIDAVARDVPIDRRRVALVGHSLGAVTASRLAVMKPGLITGAVCIAGFADLVRGGEAAPRMVYLAEFDPLFPRESTSATVESARRRGEPVELEVIPHEGHTLVVGKIIPQAIRWILARAPRTIDAAKPTASAPRINPMKTDSPAPSESDARPSSGPTK